MRLTQTLFKQPIQFHFRKNWQAQKKRAPILDNAEVQLERFGIKCVDANEFVRTQPVTEKIKLNIVGAFPLPVTFDNNHPDYKPRDCLTLGENHLLVEGTAQAQVLAKTVVVSDGLPKNIASLVEEIPISDIAHTQVKKAILSANIFDCEQLKLPIQREPERPFHNLVRRYGITDRRRTFITTNRLLSIVERNADLGLSLGRYLSEDVESTVTFNRDDNLIQSNQCTNVLVSSLRPLPPITDMNITKNMDLPDIYPIHYTATLPNTNFYKTDNIYPINLNLSKVFHPHTVFLHFNETECTNLYELAVRDEQICGRTLSHVFSVAAAYAKTLYGNDVKVLPHPVTLQAVQTDGRLFHFGVFQLNTLKLEDSGDIKNIWWSVPRIPLFGECKYNRGQPDLISYNPEVYKYLNAFYNNH